VLTGRAVPFSRGDDMPKLVKAAHRTLDRLPGRGQAGNIAVRNLSQAALTIVTILTELRNELGTGHGRARVPRVSREAAVAATDASILWTRWALARLDELIGGEVDRLIDELRSGSFYRGLLNQRFDEVGLDDLFADDQYRLGAAVAQRSMNGTFVVWESGVTPIADMPLDWPEDYRRGVAVGLLLGPEGSLVVRPLFVPALAAVVAEMAPADWSELSAQALSAPLESSIATDYGKLCEIQEILEAQAVAMPPSAWQAWDALTARFAAPAVTPEAV
jgi:Abortive infection C-terminus